MTVVCVRGEHTACLGGRCPCECHPVNRTLPLAIAITVILGVALVSVWLVSR